MYYAAITGKELGIVLILEDPNDKRFLKLPLALVIPQENPAHKSKKKYVKQSQSDRLLLKLFSDKY